jgi:mono/diheme cytochrome c family protein
VRKTINGLLAVGFVCAWVGCAQAADEAAPAVGGTLAPVAAPAGGQTAIGATGGEAAAAGACCKADDTTPPLDLIKATPQGGLHNPYDDQIDKVAEEGHKKFLSLGCNGCHGGGGGGGMCPPLTNDVWVYQGDDDTLFRLISLGSDGLQKSGYVRVKHEVVVGPMPPFGGIVKTSDDLWKVIAWIRSVNPDSVKLESTPYAKPNY